MLTYQSCEGEIIKEICKYLPNVGIPISAGTPSHCHPTLDNSAQEDLSQSTEFEAYQYMVKETLNESRIAPHSPQQFPKATAQQKSSMEEGNQQCM